MKFTGHETFLSLTASKAKFRARGIKVLKSDKRFNKFKLLAKHLCEPTRFWSTVMGAIHLTPIKALTVWRPVTTHFYLGHDFLLSVPA